MTPEVHSSLNIKTTRTELGYCAQLFGVLDGSSASTLRELLHTVPKGVALELDLTQAITVEPDYLGVLLLLREHVSSMRVRGARRDAANYMRMAGIQIEN